MARHLQLSQAFREAGFWFRVLDYQFRFTCSCGRQQALDACATEDHDGVTIYTCKHCNRHVAGVTEERNVDPLGGRAADHDGHNMCGYVFGSTVDLELWPAAATEPFMKIPRRPAFFVRVRGEGGPPAQAS